MVPEAPLERGEHGPPPAGEGWFVLNAKDARWRQEGRGARLTFFEGNAAMWPLGVDEETTEPSVAYARFPAHRFSRDEEGWLP